MKLGRIVLCTLMMFFLSARGSQPSNREIIINGETFYVEIARTEAERARGLMYRKTLNERQGMLFVFELEQPLSFWMSNTYLPLSLAFLSNSGEILEIVDMQPLSRTTVQSRFPSKYALELLQGSFRQVGAKVGDYIILPARLRM